MYPAVALFAMEDLQSLLREVEGREWEARGGLAAVLCKVSWFPRFLHWIIFALQDSEVTWLLRLALRKQDGLSGWLAMH